MDGYSNGLIVMHLHVSMLSPGGFDFSEEFLPKIPTLELKIDQIPPAPGKLYPC